VASGLSWQEVAVVLVAIPAALATLFLQSILLGEGRTVPYNGVETALALLTVVALIVGFTSFDLGPLAAIVILSAQYVIAAIVYLALAMRHSPRLLRPDRRLAREMLKYGFRVYVATLIAFLVIRIDLLMVNGFLGEKEAGLYSVAVAIADAVYLIPSIIALNLFPRVAEGGDTEGTAQVFRTVAVVYGVICAASAALAGPAVHLFYGDRFGEAATLYLWLVPGIYSLGMLNILAYHFAGRGYPREAVLVWFAGLAVNLGMNVTLLHNGTYVAALSSSVAYVLLLFLHVRLFAKESGGYLALRPRLGETAGMMRGALRRGAQMPPTA
jgi:O-antigen/teichoic acid export membrane protein